MSTHERRRTLLRTARDVAEDLATDAIVRDQAGRPPVDEAARLREAGLLAALTPPLPGGGTDWRTACAVIREVAAADSSLGEVLARHYTLTWSGRFYTWHHGASDLEEATVREQWLWAGAVRTPGPAHEAGGPDLTLTPLDTGYVLNGRRLVDTAVTVADQFLVDAVCAVTGDVLVIRIPAGAPGVIAEPADDRLGQRVAGAGAVVMDGVVVTSRQVVGHRPQDEESTAPFTALAEPALRLALCHVGLGIAEGALAEARDLGSSARFAGPAGDDPDLLLTYGELASATQTAAAVVERATDAMALALSTGAELDPEDPAAVDVLVATAETVTARAALHITTRVLELGDAVGLDRFWRNARTLTAHHPAAHRLRAIGDHYLSGQGRATARAITRP
ncbi:acyl-CoA dehydrogenase family protein [Streptomyces sp. NPDC101160]|uniref:acyl-CoA dehydrogenase family protein n=1 Tax=Streptomyces sp. NPDC101160 TaxID=3366118 RepID=UPI0037F6A3EA